MDLVIQLINGLFLRITTLWRCVLMKSVMTGIKTRGYDANLQDYPGDGRSKYLF